ncbi:MAG: hypothetical protein AB1632_07710 [Nitrospirota bacterium]
MESSKEICILCAWRENCQKKFSVSKKDIRCPDFVRDQGIKEDQGGRS